MAAGAVRPPRQLHSPQTHTMTEREKDSAGVRVDSRAQKILAVSVVVLP